VIIKGERRAGEQTDGGPAFFIRAVGSGYAIRYYAGRKHLWAMSVPRRVRCPVEASPPRRLKGAERVAGGQQRARKGGEEGEKGRGERKKRNERKGRSRGRLSPVASCLVLALPSLPPSLPPTLPLLLVLAN